MSESLDKQVAPERATERLLTLRQVAKLLQFDERTIRRWIARHGFPCFRLGTRLRFSQRNVLRWVSAREEDK